MITALAPPFGRGVSGCLRALTLLGVVWLLIVITRPPMAVVGNSSFQPSSLAKLMLIVFLTSSRRSAPTIS